MESGEQRRAMGNEIKGKGSRTRKMRKREKGRMERARREEERKVRRSKEVYMGYAGRSVEEKKEEESQGPRSERKRGEELGWLSKEDGERGVGEELAEREEQWYRRDGKEHVDEERGGWKGYRKEREKKIAKRLKENRKGVEKRKQQKKRQRRHGREVMQRFAKP